jgi:hypothetical protein
MEPQPGDTPVDEIDEEAGDGSGIESDIADEPSVVTARKPNTRTSKKRLATVSE